MESHQSLDVIKALVSREDFNSNSQWLDYNALNNALKYGRKDIVQVLLSNNCRVSKPDGSHADTPLHHAVQLADPELISDLLKRKAAITIPNADGNSPLHLAFLHKQENVVDIMLDYIVRKSTFLNLKNNQGLTHLHIACTRSNAKAIEGFLSRKSSIEDVISKDFIMWAGYNALHFAAEFKSLTAIKILMLQNSVEAVRASFHQNRLGKTPLQLIKQQLEELSIMASFMTVRGFSPFHMALVGDDSRLVKTFLENNMDPNRRSLLFQKFCSFYTPLHLATQSRTSENVKLLLQYKADANARNNDEMTPVQLALYNETSVNDKLIISMLYSATKDKLNQVPDKNGLSFMHLACSMNDLEMAKKFLKKGEDVNSKVTYELQQLYNYTPLHFAIRHGHLDMAKYLVGQGADVNCGEDCVDGTPLHLACKVGHQGLMKFLLENGANVKTTRAYDKKTPLHLLVENCILRASLNNPSKIPWIAKFIECGVDVNAQDTEGNTILHQACSKIFGGIRSLKLLLEHGADINIENNAGLTPFACQLSSFYIKSQVQPGDYTILYHHVQDLKAIGLNVNPKNEACCKRILQEKIIFWDANSPDFAKEELARKQQQRINEVTKMKAIRITNDVSIYDFVRMEPKLAKNFVTHETLIAVLQKEFPVYGYLLKLQHKRAVEFVEVKEEGSNKRKAVNAESGVSSMAAKRRRSK